MSESNMNLRMTKKRAERLRQVMEETSESTKAGAIDLALSHYLEDLWNKQRVADDLPADLPSELSTPWLPIERETRVGRSPEK